MFSVCARARVSCVCARERASESVSACVLSVCVCDRVCVRECVGCVRARVRESECDCVRGVCVHVSVCACVRA